MLTYAQHASTLFKKKNFSFIKIPNYNYPKPIITKKKSNTAMTIIPYDLRYKNLNFNDI
jgi:hypothetical protein